MKHTTLKILIIAFTVIGVTMSIFWPHVLASNKFLENFVNHEILSLLVVILTITFASVANIHLSVSRSQMNIQDKEAREALERNFARPLQQETESSAWLLFWSLAICTGAVLVKGQYPLVTSIVSVCHATALIVMFINAAVLHDIYGTVFALVGVKGAEFDE